jgi:hypothetical protein
VVKLTYAFQYCQTGCLQALLILRTGERTTNRSASHTKNNQGADMRISEPRAVATGQKVIRKNKEFANMISSQGAFSAGRQPFAFIVGAAAVNSSSR